MILESKVLAFDVSPGLLGIASTNSLGELVANLLPTFVSLGGLLLFAYLVMGGFKYMTSGGDEKAIGEAKKIITNALIGIFIIFTSFWVVRIIETLLGLNITGFNP